MIEQNKNKLPQYYVIKKDLKNSLWEKYISWLNLKAENNFTGNSLYYGYDGRYFYKTIFADFDNTPTLITLEEWDNIVNPKEEKYTIQQCIDQKIAIRITNTEEATKILDILEKVSYTLLYYGLLYDCEVFFYKNNGIVGFFYQGGYKGTYFINNSVVGTSCKATKCIEFKQVILNMNNTNNTNQEIKGYKIKEEYLEAVSKLLAHKYTLCDKCSFLIDSTAFHRLKEYNVLDIFCDKVYKPKYELPIINGKSGIIENGMVIYGNNCAKFDVEFFFDLNDIILNQGSSDNSTGYSNKQNRKINSITLDSNVTITIEQIKQIVDYINN